MDVCSLSCSVLGQFVTQQLTTSQRITDLALASLPSVFPRQDTTHARAHIPDKPASEVSHALGASRLSHPSGK